MDITSIALLFLGWLLYWLIKANTERMGNTSFTIRAFLRANVLEIGISITSCLVLVIINAPPAAGGMEGKLLIVGSGYTSTSIIKNLLPAIK
ncbi:MAG TPA: hypothetical protein VG603_11370 [Chitinophagales bacterium]|nr:hypothetical protein [Chitinophagales bacterium]